MPTMPTYPIHCDGCGHKAQYKIAVCWSDGITRELKTYSFSCHNCLSTLYPQAISRQQNLPLTSGEPTEIPHIYQLGSGTRDRELLQMTELEKGLR